MKKARRYRAIEIQAGDHAITAAEPLPADLRRTVAAINDATPPAH